MVEFVGTLQGEGDHGPTVNRTIARTSGLLSSVRRDRLVGRLHARSRGRSNGRIGEVEVGTLSVTGIDRICVGSTVRTSWCGVVTLGHEVDRHATSQGHERSTQLVRVGRAGRVHRTGGSHTSDRGCLVHILEHSGTEGLTVFQRSICTVGRYDRRGSSQSKIGLEQHPNLQAGRKPTRGTGYLFRNLGHGSPTIGHGRYVPSIDTVLLHVGHDEAAISTCRNRLCGPGAPSIQQ